MATAAVTYTFTNGTPADASEVNTNFTALTNFLNNSVVHRDGSKAMTAAMDAGGFKITNLGTPTGNADAATKLYVDDNIASGKTARFTRTTDISVTTGASGSVTFETESNDDDGWWSSGTTFTCPATGVYVISARLQKSSGAANISLSLSASFSTPSAEASTSAATGHAVTGTVWYMNAGDTFTVNWQEFSAGSGVIDFVALTITKVATF